MGNSESLQDVSDKELASSRQEPYSCPCAVTAQDGGIVPQNCIGDHQNLLLSLNGETLSVASGSRTITSSRFADILSIKWSHGESCFQISLQTGWMNVSVPNSVIVEYDFVCKAKKLERMSGTKQPPFFYVGVFAGLFRPKPGQRKRGTTSTLPPDQLPDISVMQRYAKRSVWLFETTAQGQSRRENRAIEQIITGQNSFAVTSVSGVSTESLGDDPRMVFDENTVYILPNIQGNPTIKFEYTAVRDWELMEELPSDESNSYHGVGLKFNMHDSQSVFVMLTFINDAKNTLEYYWNMAQLAEGKSVKPSNTIGRPLLSVPTFSGLDPAPPLTGNYETVDMDGHVYHGPSRARSASSPRLSILSPRASFDLGFHHATELWWSSVLKHQGWLWKRGGPTKSWIKRFFVLYSTSQGHYLMYYKDQADIPLYTNDGTVASAKHRKVVDISKAVYINPFTAISDAPIYAFDIVTIERPWTLGAQNQEDKEQWLKILERAMELDAAKLPDDTLNFQVTVAVDPSGQLSAFEGGVWLKVNAQGLQVRSATEVQSAHDPSFGAELLHFVFTDFYKWSPAFGENDRPAVMIQVFVDDTFEQVDQYVFYTPKGQILLQALEHYNEKFFQLMHLTCEGGAEPPQLSFPSPDPTASSLSVYKSSKWVRPLRGAEVTMSDDVSFSAPGHGIGMKLL